MPGRAFIPGPLGQAQPRVYKSFRGRQIRGLLLAGTGIVLGFVIFGTRDVTGYAATFLLGVPGFAYGYFQPDGKPVEYWVLVLLRYQFTMQRLPVGPPVSWWSQAGRHSRRVLRALRRTEGMRMNEEGKRRG